MRKNMSMRTGIISMVMLFLFGFETSQMNAQTTSASNNLVAHPIPDRTISYSITDAGVSKPITWGLDLAWLDEGNVRRGVAFMGADRVDVVRSSFTPTAPLVNGDLQSTELARLNQRLSIINSRLGSNTQVILNCDHPTVDSWYVGNAANWAQLIDVTTRRHQEAGLTVVTVSPFNEPDNASTGQGTITDFYNICGELRNNSRFNNIRISGGNTLNCDQALPWYNTLKARLDEGNTHQLAGTFDSYVNFYTTVKANGDYASNDELHNVMEAMVGVEYGMQTGIWWGTAELARSEFVKASDGVRLGYAEHRPNWTAASVYRGIDGKVQAFGGTSERQAATTTYRFVSKDKDVYYDGYGPQREYTMVMPGGAVGSYQDGQTNAERVVNITWGDDIQPAINGNYVLVNRNSGKVMEVAGGSMDNGAIVQQNTKISGATYQQWNVTQIDPRIGGDFSYFTFASVYTGKALDVNNWSLENGGIIDVWDDYKNLLQQWYIDYAGDGWFYIRSRFSAKCLEVANANTADGASIVQWDKNEGTNQQWRFLPVGAPVEFIAPSAPTNLVATSNAESVLLSWTSSTATDVAGYTIFRSETANGPYNTIARNVTTTSFVDNTATSGGLFFYRIKAVDNSLNRSAYSNEVSATANGSNAIITRFSFDGNTLDSSVNLNHSAPFGGTTFVTGKVGSQAIALNGTNTFIQLPATMANQQEITVATWVYWNGGANWQRIFDFGNSESQYLFLTPKSGTGQLYFAIKNGGAEQIVETSALPTGTWTHIAVTLGASGVSMYVNGILVAESAAVTIRPLDFKPVLNYIGRSQYPDPLFNGNIDDFRVYNYALSVNEVRVLAGINDPSVGTILREYWNNISGTSISNLTSYSNYPNSPTGSEQLISLEGPTNAGDNYGTRIRGYVIPPVTGVYTFWVAGDDYTDLYLSTNDNPANATRIAYVSGWTNSREWTKYTSQKSASINLTAGQKYYIDVLHKEGSGGDNIAVAWQGPNISQAVIAGSYLSPFVVGTGTILREYWNNISGTSISNLTSNSNYPNSPSGSEQLTSLEGPTNTGDNYGTRIRGYVIPPVTGVYTFWVAGDDYTDLYLSTNDNPANATRIAYVSGWTNSREWTKYTSQKSASINLTAGQKYYIEVLHKEGSGGDNIAVAWQGPNISQAVIAGTYLSSTGLKSAEVYLEEISTVDEVSDDVALFPNPFNSGINLRIDDPAQITSIRVFDMVGKQIELIDHADVKNLQTIGSSLKVGMYLVQVCSSNKIQTFKILKK